MIPPSERREARIAVKLWKMGYEDIFEGTTEHDEPKERLRRLIISKGIADMPFMRREDGTQVSLGAAFVETYGEPLVPAEAAA